MRYLDILMFVFCFNAALYLMTIMGLHTAFGGAHEMEAEQIWVGSFNTTASTESLKWSNPSILDFFLTAGVTLLNGITIFLQIFGSVVLLVPTLMKFNLPLNVSLVLAAPIYFVYMWGLIQVFLKISGRNVE